MQRYKKNVIYTNLASCQPHKSSFLSIALYRFFSSLAFSSLVPLSFSLFFLTSLQPLPRLSLTMSAPLSNLVPPIYNLFISSPFSLFLFSFYSLSRPPFAHKLTLYMHQMKNKYGKRVVIKKKYVSLQTQHPTNTIPITNKTYRFMTVTEQTTQQVERFLRKISQKYSSNDNSSSLATDIHIFLSQDSGEMIAFDDDNKEITRCVVEQWINNTDERFYAEASKALRTICEGMRQTLEGLAIMKPYSIVLENDEGENIAELFLADDDTIIIGGDLMDGLDQDLNAFLNKILDEGEDEMKNVKV